MLLLTIDAFLFVAVLLIAFFSVRQMIRNNKQEQIKQAKERQKLAESLVTEAESIDAEAIKQNEKKVQDKLDGLH